MNNILLILSISHIYFIYSNFLIKNQNTFQSRSFNKYDILNHYAYFNTNPYNDCPNIDNVWTDDLSGNIQIGTQIETPIVKTAKFYSDNNFYIITEFISNKIVNSDSEIKGVYHFDLFTKNPNTVSTGIIKSFQIQYKSSGIIQSNEITHMKGCSDDYSNDYCDEITIQLNRIKEDELYIYYDDCSSKFSPIEFTDVVGIIINKIKGSSPSHILFPASDPITQDNVYNVRTSLSNVLSYSTTMINKKQICHVKKYDDRTTLVIFENHDLTPVKDSVDQSKTKLYQITNKPSIIFLENSESDFNTTIICSNSQKDGDIDKFCSNKKFQFQLKDDIYYSYYDGLYLGSDKINIKPKIKEDLVLTLPEKYLWCFEGFLIDKINFNIINYLLLILLILLI